MNNHRRFTGALCVFLAMASGCAIQPAADAAREDLVYFDNLAGRQEKVATLISRAPDGRTAFFLRSPVGNPVIVCVGQPPAAGQAAQNPALERLQAAFFQNCIARANGFIDEREFLRVHRMLVNAASKPQRSENAPGSAAPR